MLSNRVISTLLMAMLSLSLLPSVVLAERLKKSSRLTSEQPDLKNQVRRKLSKGTKGKGSSSSSSSEDEDSDSSENDDDDDDDDESTSKGSKSSKSSKYSKKSKSSKKTTKSSKSSEGCVDGEYDLDNDFTSFFFVLYGIDEEATMEEIEEAAGALVIAYNRIAPVTHRMDDSFLFDEDRRRRLSWDEARELQVFNSFSSIIEAAGRSSGSGNQFTLGDQISAGGRHRNRQLSSKSSGSKSSKSVPICEPGPLPTEEELRMEYNVVLEQMRGPVDEAIELEEIDEPPPPEGKGKGSKSSKSSKTTTSSGSLSRSRK